MTQRDVVVGIPPGDSLEALVTPLARVFETEFEERESEHYGGTYYLAELDGGEEIRIYANDDSAQRREFPVVVRVFPTERSGQQVAEQIRIQVHPKARLLLER